MNCPADPVAEAERALKDALDELYWAGEAAERAVIEGTQAKFNKAADRATRAYGEAEAAADRYAALKALAEVRRAERLGPHWQGLSRGSCNRDCPRCRIKALREALEKEAGDG